MKKSNQVSVSLIVALAAGMTGAGCSSGGYDECRDNQGYLVPESECATGYSTGHWVHVGGFGGSGGSSGFYGG